MPEKRRVSRRGFLKGAAAAAAFPYVLSRSVLAAPASDRIGMGFIGYGMQCRGHVGGMLGRDDVQVLAVCDCDRTRRLDACHRADERYGQPKGTDARGCADYNDFRQLLDRKDIDAVLIAAPDHWHAIPVIRAAEAGKDIYCEKPLSLTIVEARAMVTAVRRYGRVFQTGSQQRSGREFLFACEMVRSGRIGRVETVYVNVGGPSSECYLPGQAVPEGLDWDLWLGPAPWRPYHPTICPGNPYSFFPNWRAFRDYSGGGMTDWGAHHFDIAQWGLGMDESGPVEIIPPDGKAHQRLTYKYASGVVMCHGGGRSGVDFVGTEGRVMVNRGQLATEPADLMKTPTQPNEVHLYKSPGHREDWLNCIRSRSRPICDVEIGCRSVSVCHLGNIAYLLGRPLRWDPAREAFLGDEEANRLLDRPKRAPWIL